jgi:putative acetyltransferase
MHADTPARLAPLDPMSPGAQDLIVQSEALMNALYPAESNHFEPAANLQPPGGAFWGCWLGDELVGCGGVKFHAAADEPAYGEIKRLFVRDNARGRGVARRLMVQLEAELLTRGLEIARLETGVLQPAALALYRRLGYGERGPFGGYAADPLSTFFEKQLAAPKR